MKKAKLFLVTTAILCAFILVFGACEELLEDDGVVIYGETMSYDGELDSDKWFEILDDIAKHGEYVILDLQKCTYVTDNVNGGLVKVTIMANEFIAFDPFPNARGKDLIVSIILPDIATMIIPAVEDDIDVE